MESYQDLVNRILNQTHLNHCQNKHLQVANCLCWLVSAKNQQKLNINTTHTTAVTSIPSSNFDNVAVSFANPLQKLKSPRPNKRLKVHYTNRLCTKTGGRRLTNDFSQVTCFHCLNKSPSFKDLNGNILNTQQVVQNMRDLSS